MATLLHDLKSIKPTDLPSPPQTAIQIMRACAKDEVNHSQLAKLAGSDPALSAELLRVVNSPYFGLTRNITSIPRAVTVLGQRALRNVALCVSVRDALKQDELPGVDIADFWEDAIRRAVIARRLGGYSKLDIDDCFTAGLLQDFGLLVMLYLNPQHAEQWPSLRVLSPEERLKKEQSVFNTTHEAVGLILSDAWDLPQELGAGMGHHHDLSYKHSAEQQVNLCKTLYCADWLACVYTMSDKTTIIPHCQSLLKEQFGLDKETTEDILCDVPTKVNEASQALGLGIKNQQDFEQILRNANVHLAEANMSYQELTWQLEQTLRERDRIKAILDRELDLAREIQTSLLPSNTPDHFPIQGLNVSARELSGDFFDFFTLPDGRIYFILGDVSGKGINAALLMAKASSLFRCLGKRIHDPSELIYSINNELCETSIRGMFITLIAGLYTPTDKNIVLVNAGHVPAIIADADGKFAKIPSKAIPVGILADNAFPATKFNLGQRRLYIYSDGVTEGELANGKEFGLQGLITMISNIRHKPVKQQLTEITSLFTSSNDPLRDDITLLVIG